MLLHILLLKNELSSEKLDGETKSLPASIKSKYINIKRVEMILIRTAGKIRLIILHLCGAYNKMGIVYREGSGGGSQISDMCMLGEVFVSDQMLFFGVQKNVPSFPGKRTTIENTKRYETHFRKTPQTNILVLPSTSGMTALFKSPAPLPTSASRRRE